MAFVTYILLSTLIAGFRGAFRPELLGLTATTAFAVVIFEILGLKLGCYLLSISNDSQLFDLVAYSGYKFVGIIMTILIGEIGSRGAGAGGWIGWTVFIYTFLALAFFLVSMEESNLSQAQRTDSHSCDHSSTSFYRTIHLMGPSFQDLSETGELSSYSFIRTLCSWHSCGYYQGNRRSGEKV